MKIYLLLNICMEMLVNHDINFRFSFRFFSYLVVQSQSRKWVKELFACCLSRGYEISLFLDIFLVWHFRFLDFDIFILSFSLFSVFSCNLYTVLKWIFIEFHPLQPFFLYLSYQTNLVTISHHTHISHKTLRTISQNAIFKQKKLFNFIVLHNLVKKSIKSKSFC